MGKCNELYVDRDEFLEKSVQKRGPKKEGFLIKKVRFLGGVPKILSPPLFDPPLKMSIFGTPSLNNILIGYSKKGVEKGGVYVSEKCVGKMHELSVDRAKPTEIWSKMSFFDTPPFWTPLLFGHPPKKPCF